MKTLNFSGLIICAVRRPPHLSAPTRNNKLSVACHRAASAGAFSMNIIFSVRHTICGCLHPSILPVCISCYCPLTGNGPRTL